MDKILFAALLFLAFAGKTLCQQAVPPREVKVLPVFFVPLGETVPGDAQVKKLMRHLEWSRTRYREMLGGRDSFTIAETKPHIYRAEHPLSYYRSQPDQGAPTIAGELLKELNCNRYTCPYVLLTVLVNPSEDFPQGGGRPLNGGYNTGGGIVVVSSFALDRLANFQSTLQHELGHGFGLPHVNVYGYDMKTNASVMSYNPRHHTRNFNPSLTPGTLIPEDLRALALNHRVLPLYRFGRERDVPPGYKIAERVVPIGPMTIPDQPGTVLVTTKSGEDFGSKVANIVHGPLLPSVDTGQVTFDGKAMWQSAKSPTRWVSVAVTFPFEVELTGIGVHSQHSGKYHPARAARVLVQGSAGNFLPVASTDLKSVDATVALPKTKGKVWQFDFQAGETGIVVLRGLQFFADAEEVFPPLVPAPP